VPSCVCVSGRFRFCAASFAVVACLPSPIVLFLSLVLIVPKDANRKAAGLGAAVMDHTAPERRWRGQAIDGRGNRCQERGYTFGRIKDERESLNVVEETAGKATCSGPQS
jgi:hypothetical protein